MNERFLKIKNLTHFLKAKKRRSFKQIDLEFLTNRLGKKHIINCQYTNQFTADFQLLKV